MQDYFHKPVRILVGLGFPRDISGPLEAIVYLDGVPRPARDHGHVMAYKACKAALLGEIEAETARGLFEAYADKQAILAPGMGEVVAAGFVGRNDPHTF